MMSYPPFIFSLVHAKLYQRSDYILLNISPTPYPRYLCISRNRTILGKYRIFENNWNNSKILFDKSSYFVYLLISDIFIIKNFIKNFIMPCTDDRNFNK